MEKIIQKTTEIYDVLVAGERPKIEKWLAERQGVIVFRDQEISRHPRGDVFTPVIDADGNNNVDSGAKPHWAYGVHEVITDIARFRFVKEWKEVGRSKPRATNKSVQSQHDRLRVQLGVPVYQRYDDDVVVFEIAVWEQPNNEPIKNNS